MSEMCVWSACVVNVCGRPFEAKRKFRYLYGKIGHKEE